VVETVTGVPAGERLFAKGLSTANGFRKAPVQAIPDSALERGMAALRKHCETASRSGPVYEKVDTFSTNDSARIGRFPGRICRVVWILSLLTKGRPMESADYVRFVEFCGIL
jgi:hypothetical protein